MPVAGSRWCGRFAGHRIERAAQSAGVARFVLRIETTQHGAGVLVDLMHGGEIPGGVSHRDALQVPVAGGHLEATALDRHRDVAPA